MKGFTFVELMIAVSIMLLLLLLSFPFYTSINKQLTIDRASTRLVQDIRKAIEMTMSAQKFGTDYPDGGYGIYFPSASSDKYYLFADTNENRRYDSGELVEEIKIEGKIQITGKTVNLDNITFKAPEPIALLSNPSGVDLVGVTEVYVLFSDGSNSRYIYINKAGRVYIQ